MTVHFICRGNVFRSIIAEAYLNSLGLKDLNVKSSGTVADEFRQQNIINIMKTRELLKIHNIDKFAKVHYAEQISKGHIKANDLIIFMNNIVQEEFKRDFQIPKKSLTWDIADLGEKGRIPRSEQERAAYSEDVYLEVVGKVNELVDYLKAGQRLKGLPR